MMLRSVISATLLVASMVPMAHAQSVTIFSTDFNTGNGGFTVYTPQPYDGPWVYDVLSGSWGQNGQAPENNRPNTSMLNSPSIIITGPESIALSFEHRHSLELGFWDGGQVRVSVNHGPYNAVPNSAFLQNGYNGSVIGFSASVLSGQRAFVESPGIGFDFYKSVADLGSFATGDTISVQFVVGNDTNTSGPNLPNWEIDSFTLSTILPGANLLGNAGFESQIDYVDVEARNWFAFFGGGSLGTTSTVDSAFSGSIMPYEGTHHLSISNGGTANGYSGVFQNVAVVEGKDYAFGFAAKQIGPVFNLGAEFRVEWYDAFGNLIGGQFDLNTPIENLTENYQDYSLTATAPEHAVRATAVIAVQSFVPPPPGGASEFFGQLYVDSTFFGMVIPEPSAIILALGIVPASIRRRWRPSRSKMSIALIYRV